MDFHGNVLFGMWNNDNLERAIVIRKLGAYYYDSKKANSMD